MSLHLRLTVAHGLLMVAAFFFFPSLSYAAPVEVPETTVETRDSDDGNHAINPGMIAGLSFAVLFGMSIVFTAVRASIDRRRLLKAKSGIPQPVASTAPNAPLLVAAADIAVQEPLPAYKAEEPVKMTAEEVEYHSIMATRTTRPPSYSSTTGTLRDDSFNYASSDASSR